jgi:nickel transport protein
MKKLSNINKWYFFTLVIANAVIADSVLAHGANIKHQQTPAIVIKAAFDDGTPMANAQAIVYSPDDPANPWLKGTTDSEGKFTFVPESQVSGNWDVKVRQAGHGDIASISLEQENSASDTNSSTTQNKAGIRANLEEILPLQKVLMISTTVWGFIGTALFFARNKQNVGSSEGTGKS